MHSWELLSKIWEQKLALYPNNPKVLEEIADVSGRAGISGVAIKKYCQVN
jgi:hypothetical protein